MKNMSNKAKLKKINQYLEKLMLMAENGVKKNKYELALSALSAYCALQYNVNQIYTDRKAEDLIFKISKAVVQVSDGYTGKQNSVLFYDGFGLDLRGWAAAYVRAIVRNGYDLIYVTNKKCKDDIPHILSEMEGSSAKVHYVDMASGYLKWTAELHDIFKKYQPKTAFFYTNPNDVAATAVFDAYKGKVTRFQIDLTDHAFWIGVKGADYFLECRMPGASNAIYERGVLGNRIINIDCCLYINRDKEESPLPFDISKERYIFSGGALYKTLGDREMLFYKVLDHILERDKKVKYLYAGYGDESELVKLGKKYQNRVYHIGERKDFYYLIENCVFMWNTYPMFGGLMMRFAANAGRIPLTLKHGQDHEGLLKNQSDLGIEFDTYEEVIEEADRLLSDDSYRVEKERKLRNSVLGEEEFGRNIKLIIEEQKSEFEFGEIQYVNTEQFRRTYIERLEDPIDLASRCIVNKNNYGLSLYFPMLIVKRVAGKLLKRRIRK